MSHLLNRRWTLLLLTAVLGALLFGVASPARPAPLAIVVATIPPLADVAGQLGGDLIEVEALLPPGASPHTFEPRPAQVRSIARAKLLVAVGAGLDEWALRLASDGNAQVLFAAEAVERAGLGLPSGADEHGHGTAGAIDPHVWLDPVAVRDAIAPALAEALIELLPEHAGSIRENLEAFQRQLDAVDQEVRALLDALPERAFISYHSAWGYFARRYGLREVASVAGFPGQEPSARWIASVVETARRHGVRVIFAEPQLSPKAAQVIADEIGGEVLLLDPLGGGELSRYVDLIRFNASALAKAFLAAEGEEGAR